MFSSHCCSSLYLPNLRLRQELSESFPLLKSDFPDSQPQDRERFPNQRDAFPAAAALRSSPTEATLPFEPRQRNELQRLLKSLLSAFGRWVSEYGVSWARLDPCPPILMQRRGAEDRGGRRDVHELVGVFTWKRWPEILTGFRLKRRQGFRMSRFYPWQKPFQLLKGVSHSWPRIHLHPSFHQSC